MTPDRERIDWDAVRARLAASEAALEAASAVSPERLEAVYRERAEALANRQTRAATPTGVRVLVFTLGIERYGLEFADVAKILPFAGCTPVPGGPPELLGVMNIGGDIRSVVDLGRLIGLPSGKRDTPGYVFVVRRGDREAVVRVDQVEGVSAIDPGTVAGVGEAGPGSRFLRGVTPDRVRLLGTAVVLADPLLGGTQ